MEKRRRGRPLDMAWRESDSEEALRAAYLAERDVAVRQRLHALWLLRSGKRDLSAVAAVLGVRYRRLQRWLMWYRHGGLAAVCAHRMGGKGKEPYLTADQQEALAREVATGRFRTGAAIRAWVAETYGVTYTEGGMYSLLERLRCDPKVPRPLHEKADLAVQEDWKKGGSVPC